MWRSFIRQTKVNLMQVYRNADATQKAHKANTMVNDMTPVDESKVFRSEMTGILILNF